MSNELRLLRASGDDIHARLRNPAGEIWNTSSEDFEAYAGGNVTSYNIAIVDKGGDLYVGDLPVHANIPRGAYIAQFYTWDGATPTTGDGLVGGGIVGWDDQLGKGGISFTYTLTDDNSDPVDNAQVWVTTRDNSDNVLASGVTDNNGQVIFWLDAGNIDVYRQKGGVNFTNPDQETVS